MFPNVQWLLAAMVASILVLSGGFGLFASLRVIREPLTHLPHGAGPPQSFADNAAALSRKPIIIAPFDARFPAESRPVVQVGADLKALRLDTGEASAPVAAPPAQQAVTADIEANPPAPSVSGGEQQPAAAAVRAATDTIPTGTEPEPAAVQTGDAAVVDATEVAAANAAATIELPPPPATRAIDPTAVIPLPRAAPAPTNAAPSPADAKAKPHPAAKRSARPHVAAKPVKPVAKPVAKPAARIRHARRHRLPSSGDTELTTGQTAFPTPAFQTPAFPSPAVASQPFQDHLFSSPQPSRASRRTGAAPMGGPFVVPGIDPY